MRVNYLERPWPPIHWLILTDRQDKTRTAPGESDEAICHNNIHVIPAKAGTQPCHNSNFRAVARLGSRFRGNDGANWAATGKIGGARKLHPIALPGCIKVVDTFRSSSHARRASFNRERGIALNKTG